MWSQQPERIPRAIGPVAVWALAALAGAALGSVRLGTLRPAVSGVLLAAGLLLPILHRRLTPGRGSSLVLLGVFLVAAGAAGVRVTVAGTGPLVDLARTGGVAPVRAIVASEPRPGGPGWWTVVRVDRVGEVRTRTGALLRGDADPPPLGTVFTGTASARPLDHDGFDAHVRRQHAAVELRPVRWRTAARPGRLARASEHVRAQLRTAAQRALPAPLDGLAVGLVTGDRRLIPEEVDDALRDTGLTHLVVVSGAKVAIVVAGTLLAIHVLGIGPLGRRLSVASVVAWYAFVSRWEPSVLRASVMVALLLAVEARGHLRDARHALAGAVLVLVLFDPGLAASPGLLLSAGATAGVLVVAPLIRRRLDALPGRVADLLAVTLGAQIGVAPPLLTTFGELPVASIPANIVAVPAATVSSVPVFAATVLATVDEAVAAPLLTVARPGLQVIVTAAHTLAGSGGWVRTDAPATVLFALAAAAWMLSRPGARRARIAAVATGLGAVAAVAPVAGGLVPARGLTVTAVDVGQGDALLIESPSARVLYDAGPDGGAARWLRSNGRRSLDLVVASHPHDDHVAGTLDVLRHLRVHTLWLPAGWEDQPVLEEASALAGRQGVPVHEPTVGEVAAVGDLHIEVLGPPPGRPFRASQSEANDSSTVVRVRWRDATVLLTGDVEETAQLDLLDRIGPGLAATVMQVPHHGAATSLPEFLRAPSARVAIVSVGRGNPYGHPHPETISVLEAAGVEVLRTDVDGTIRVPVPSRRDDPGAGHPVPGAVGRRTSSGWGLRCARRIATLPMTRRSTPPRPCVDGCPRRRAPRHGPLAPPPRRSVAASRRAVSRISSSPSRTVAAAGPSGT